MASYWKKLGLVFSPDGRSEWLASHAQLPVADHREGNVYRVYFASRTPQQRSHVGFVDIDILQPRCPLRVSQRPVLAPGPIGFFDEHGVFPSCVVNHDGKKYLYYIGWNQGVRAPLFYASIGLAVSHDDGESFERFSPAPILARSEFDPCLVTSPHVLYESGVWYMTYVSGIRWQELNGQLKSFYHIKSARSSDGITWVRQGKVAIDFNDARESNIARSWVIREGLTYRMWYCYAGELPYRIGYAESSDLATWKRMDEVCGLDVSHKGFDNEMTCYPNVINHQGENYMFYNGNQFGKGGFGLALEVR